MQRGRDERDGKPNGPPLQRGLQVCHTPCPPSSPPSLSPSTEIPGARWAGGGVGGKCCVTTPTPTPRRSHQGGVGRSSVTRWSPAGSLAAPETRSGRRKSQSAMQKLLVNYIKTVTLTNTHSFPPPPLCCMQSCGTAVGEKREEKK